MKQIIFIFMAILLATGMVYAQNNKEKGKAVISAEKTSHDFGTIKETDGDVSQLLRGRQVTSRLHTIPKIVPVHLLKPFRFTAMAKQVVLS